MKTVLVSDGVLAEQ